jgi:uncharacterized protein YjbI with pentapeptide repeats
MRVVKPQPVLANFCPTQWGSQAQMCIAIGVGFRLSDPRVLAHEASVWEALRAHPTIAPLSETGMPKQYAEWLLVGQTQCTFSNAELGMLRDWTAQVSLGKTVKKISAQTKVTQDSQGNTLGCLSVDHTESIQGSNAANPAGHKGASAPLQILTWHGPQSSSLAGMTPIDARWSERRQWMPNFAATLKGMAEDGSHMGWPKDMDLRYFQQAAPDQWSADAVWPQGTNYELRGFGTAGCGFKGSLPELVPDVVVRGDVNQSVALMQQTVWFLPDHDLGVMWWSGSVNLTHPLDESLSMMVVALRELGSKAKPDDMLNYAVRRTNVNAPDLQAQSDLPLLPELSNGWAWEQILNADQHPRDRRITLSYGQLREQIVEEEKRMAQAHSDIQQLIQAPSTSERVAPLASCDLLDPTAWRAKLEGTLSKRLKDETFLNQNFQGCDWTGWTLVNVRFESCVMDGNSWNDCGFENVEFIDTSFDQTYWHNIVWSQGAMERCKADNTKWQNVSLTHVRMVQCELNALEVTSGKWSHVMMDDVELLSASWSKLMTDGLVVIKSKLRGLSVRECTLNKLSMIETDSRHSQWVQSRLINAAVVEGSDLSDSFWEDCDFTSTCWIGLLAHNTRVEYCTFTNLNAQSANLRRSTWLFCSLNDAQFLNADLRDSSFEKTSLRGALLSGAFLQDSRVSHSNLIRVNTSNAVHPTPGFWRNNLEGGALMHPQRHV